LVFEIHDQALMTDSGCGSSLFNPFRFVILFEV
jgi:hypothetical protein